MYWAIDRFEGEYAVLLNDENRQRDVAKVELPEEAREGDVLVRDDSGAYRIDVKETAERRRRAKELFESILNGT